MCHFGFNNLSGCLFLLDHYKLYALHAPEVECIGKGKARNPYEFGVKSAVVVSHQNGLILGARTFPGNPYDGHILSAVLEQTANLTQDLPVKVKHVVLDLGFRGAGSDNPDKEIIHRGKIKKPEQAAKALAQTANSGGACHWTSEVGSPHGSVLAARRFRRCAARDQLCSGLQTCAGYCAPLPVWALRRFFCANRWQRWSNLGLWGRHTVGKTAEGQLLQAIGSPADVSKNQFFCTSLEAAKLKVDFAGATIYVR